jgi:hypothetical protein
VEPVGADHDVGLGLSPVGEVEPQRVALVVQADTFVTVPDAVVRHR